MTIAVGWLLSVSLSVSDVLFMLVIRTVAVGWQLYVALLVGVVLFRMELVVVSLLFSGGLFKLDRRLVAV